MTSLKISIGKQIVTQDQWNTELGHVASSIDQQAGISPIEKELMLIAGLVFNDSAVDVKTRDELKAAKDWLRTLHCSSNLPTNRFQEARFAQYTATSTCSHETFSDIRSKAALALFSFINQQKPLWKHLYNVATSFSEVQSFRVNITGESETWVSMQTQPQPGLEMQNGEPKTITYNNTMSTNITRLAQELYALLPKSQRTITDTENFVMDLKFSEVEGVYIELYRINTKDGEDSLQYAGKVAIPDGVLQEYFTQFTEAPARQFELVKNSLTLPSSPAF